MRLSLEQGHGLGTCATGSAWLVDIFPTSGRQATRDVVLCGRGLRLSIQIEKKQSSRARLFKDSISIVSPVELAHPSSALLS